MMQPSLEFSYTLISDSDHVMLCQNFPTGAFCLIDLRCQKLINRFDLDRLVWLHH